MLRRQTLLVGQAGAPPRPPPPVMDLVQSLHSGRGRGELQAHGVRGRLTLPVNLRSEFIALQQRICEPSSGAATRRGGLTKLVVEEMSYTS